MDASLNPEVISLEPTGAETKDMATTSSNSGAEKPTTTRRSTGTRRTSARATTARSRSTSTSRSRSARASTTSTQARTAAERAVLVPVGASLLARDNLVSTVKGFATKYRTRAGLEREIKRYERRGASARNRFERQVRRTRTKFERELRQRRTRLERSVKQSSKRVEREVQTVRRDIGKQSDALSTRVRELISSAS
jgi:hypothetical protein